MRTTGKEQMFDYEHFFDSFIVNADYELAGVRTAYEASVRWVVLCDTNGGIRPSEIREILDG